jgi:hypothetical protein
MDISRFRVGDWVLVASGVVMLVLGLAVHWATIDAEGRNFGGARNAFDYFFTGGLAWLLVVAAGVITFLLAARTIQRGSTPWTRLILGATALATLLMLLRVILGGGADQRIGNQDVTLGRGAGMFIALIAAIGALVGALLNLREEGDSISAIFSSLSKTRHRDEAQSSENGGNRLPPPTGEVPREPPTPPGR